MTARRLETTAALVAGLLVLPAIVLLSASAIQALQPTAYKPSHSAAAIVAWFESFHVRREALIVGPLIALPLALLAIWRRLAADAKSSADGRPTLHRRVGPPSSPSGPGGGRHRHSGLTRSAGVCG